MERPNVHISLAKATTHYHRVMAGLVLAHTPPGGRVLDIGCGLGHLLELVHAADPSLELVAADSFPDCVARTQERRKLHRKRWRMPWACLRLISHRNVYPLVLQLRKNIEHLLRLVFLCLGRKMRQPLTLLRIWKEV